MDRPRDSKWKEEMICLCLNNMQRVVRRFVFMFTWFLRVIARHLQNLLKIHLGNVLINNNHFWCTVSVDHLIPKQALLYFKLITIEMSSGFKASLTLFTFTHLCLSSESYIIFPFRSKKNLKQCCISVTLCCPCRRLVKCINKPNNTCLMWVTWAARHNDVLFFQKQRGGRWEEKDRGPVAVLSWFSMKPGNKQHCHYNHSSRGKEDTVELGALSVLAH